MDGQSRISGAPIRLEHAGKAFDIPPWPIEIERQFAAWVYERSKQRIRADRRADGEAEYRERMDGLRRDYDSGVYEWGAPIVVRAWQSPSGSRHLVYLTLRALDKTVTPEWVEAMARDRRAWDDLWEDLIALNFTDPEEAEETPPTPEGGAGATTANSP